MFSNQPAKQTTPQSLFNPSQTIKIGQGKPAPSQGTGSPQTPNVPESAPKTLNQPAPNLFGQNIAKSQNTGGSLQKLPKDQQKDKLTNKVNEQGNKGEKIKQNANSTGKTGGVLSAGGNQNQKNVNLAIDTTLHFGLQDIMNAIVQGKKLQGRHLQKIQNNFCMYVKSKDKPFSIQNISTEKQLEYQSKKTGITARILQLSYLNGIQPKTRITINQFWETMIKDLCSKLPFLSQIGCLEIIKLQISMNKPIYCQKNDFGTLNPQIFANPHLFPIVNNKIQLNMKHQLYLRVYNEIISLILNLFQALTAIFKEMSFMKIHQINKYNNVFSLLQQKKQRKRKILTNLFKSFVNMLQTIPQNKFQKNLIYLEAIAQSIWQFYMFEKEVFSDQHCKIFIKKLNENYNFFNREQKLKSQLFEKLFNTVEKIVISILLNYPFQFKNWTTQMKDLIFKSNLDMFKPFILMLPPNQRQERTFFAFNYETKGMHWKQFIEILIKLGYEDSETTDFILKSMKVLLSENSKLFWQNISQFETFFIYTNRLLSKTSSSFGINQSRNYLIKVLEIASSLMGNIESSDFSESKEVQGGVMYPENRQLPYALNVHNEFSQYFFKMNKKQFMGIVCSELGTFILESKENEQDYQYEDHGRLKAEYVLKEYVLKLIQSEPSLIFDIKKYLPEIKEQELVEYTVIQTITDSQSSIEIVDLAFAALDRMLIDINTSKLIQNILSLDYEAQNDSVESLVRRVFSNVWVLPYLARHCGVLIEFNYQNAEWTRELLNSFYQFSKQQGYQSFKVNSPFAKSYYQLISTILTKVNDRQQLCLGEVKPYVNVEFIVESLKYYLKFDYFRGDYVNIAVCQLNLSKLEAMMECIRLYNIILLHQLKLSNIVNNKFDIKSPNIYSQQSPLKSTLLSLYEAKQLGIKDKQFNNQVKSLRNQSTSYLNALSFILVSSNHQQKQLMKQINSDYSQLIMETIQLLVKLNPGQNLKNYFQIKNTNLNLIYSQIKNLSTPITNPQPNLSYLLKFISFIQHTLSYSGIEVIIFGQLIDDHTKLRSLIDQVREKVENPRVRQRMSVRLGLKVMSTLSRYFRLSIHEMVLAKNKENSFDSMWVRQHFDYLLQTIVKFTYNQKSSKKLWQIMGIQNILKNIYGAILTVQTINGAQFLKWLKNYSILLLSDINLTYLKNKTYASIRVYQEDLQSQIVSGYFKYSSLKDKEESSFQHSFGITQEYFKLLQLLLNSQLILTQKQFNVIKSINKLPQAVQNLIFNIAQYTQFHQIPHHLAQILLQILTSAVQFFTTISSNSIQTKRVISALKDIIDAQKHLIQITPNLILLQVNILNALQLTYSQQQLKVNEPNILSLQMNSISSDLSFSVIEKIIQLLKKPMKNLAFVSICNGLFSIMQNPYSRRFNVSCLLKPLMKIYEHFINAPQYYQKTFSLPEKSSFNSGQKGQSSHELSLSYRRVWILQLILAILTTTQTYPNSQYTIALKDFQSFLISNEQVLTIFGYLMKKVAFHQSENLLSWLPSLQKTILNQLKSSAELKYEQKLQLYQIIQIFSFIFSNTDWKASMIPNKYMELILALVNYRQIFEKLMFSTKKLKPITIEQKILQGISIGNYLPSQEIMNSGLRQFEKQKISSQILKSSNSYQLLNEVINFNLSIQYCLMCLSIGTPFCEALHKKNPQLADISKWNVVFLQFAESLVQKYIQIISNADAFKSILNTFSQSYYHSNKFNIPLSTSMLFTNSPSLSCCLDASYESWRQVLIESLSLLFENIMSVNSKLEIRLHSEYKIQNERFTRIIKSLKKYDKQSFDYRVYDPSTLKRELNQTLRSNLSRSFANAQVNKSLSQNINGY